MDNTVKRTPELHRQALDTIIIARNLERIADHATNIAEDVIFWIRGADVRHGFGIAASEMVRVNARLDDGSGGGRCHGCGAAPEIVGIGSGTTDEGTVAAALEEDAVSRLSQKVN